MWEIFSFYLRKHFSLCTSQVQYTSTLQLHKYFLSRVSKCVELFPLPLTHEQADKTGHYHPPIKMINWRKRSLSSRALFPFPPTYVCLSVCLRLHAQLFIPNATEEKETKGVWAEDYFSLHLFAIRGGTKGRNVFSVPRSHLWIKQTLCIHWHVLRTNVSSLQMDIPLVFLWSFLFRQLWWKSTLRM